MRALSLALILSLVATATCADPTPQPPVDPAPVNPDPPTVIFIWHQQPPPETLQIRAMHCVAKDKAQLFARGGMIEFEDYILLHEIERQLCDKDLIADVVHNKPEATAREIWLWETASKIYNSYRATPNEPVTEHDLDEIRTFITPVTTPNQTLRLLPWSTPDDGFAYVAQWEVVFPESRLTATGYCDRDTVLHEMTHFMQLHFAHAGEYQFFKVTDTEIYSTIELAAMVVETAERVRQGYTVGMLDQIAREPFFMDYPDLHWGCDYPTLRDKTWVDRPVMPIRMPAMDAALLQQYVAKYGPQFTGCMHCDLQILKQWTHDFENVGKYQYEAASDDMKRNWSVVVRMQIEAGEMTHLASTCQTWLGVQGVPAAWPQPFTIPLVEHMANEVVKTPDITELSLKLTNQVPQENLDRACDFLRRLQANGVR